MPNNLEENTAQFFESASKLSQAFVSFTGATGIAGFVFDLRTDEEVSLSNDVTDYYTEANEPVQDNIVNKPVKVTLRGTVGEYVYNPPRSKNLWEKITDKFQDSTEKLITVASYLPPLGKFSQQTFEELKTNKSNISKAFNIGVDAFKAYRNINIPDGKQESAFLFFEALWKSRQTFTIQTPYRYYTDMAIETLKAVQHGDTIDNTDFEITFKQINKVYTNDVTSNLLQGRLKQQASEVSENGITRVKQVSVEEVYPEGE